MASGLGIFVRDKVCGAEEVQLWAIEFRAKARPDSIDNADKQDDHNP
jgi:hypothetical protein